MLFKFAFTDINAIETFVTFEFIILRKDVEMNVLPALTTEIRDAFRINSIDNSCLSFDFMVNFIFTRK